MTQYTLGLTRTVGHGRAFSQLSVVPSPAVATGFTINVGNAYWELGDSLSFQIVTDSNAANRVVTLTVNDGAGVALATITANAALTASKTGLFTFLGTQTSSQGATDGPFTAPFPQVWLQPTYSIVVAFTNAQAGDQVSNVRWYRQRFVTGPQGYMLGVVDENDPYFEMWVRDRAVIA